MDTGMTRIQTGDRLRILLVEDNVGVAMSVMAAVDTECFDIDWTQDLASSVARAIAPDLDMIVLDRGLPDGDGLDFMHDLRRSGIKTPILLISARAGLDDRIQGLEAGADDYLPKPFRPEELLARCRAVSRRGKAIDESSMQAGNLRFRSDTWDVVVDGRPLALTSSKLRLLVALMQHKGRPCPRANLLSVCTAPGGQPAPNALEATVSRLRVTLQEAGASVSITTVRGIGYMLRPTNSRPDAGAMPGRTRELHYRV
jgi:DNA-binding response OmpR family regulator